MRRSFLLLTVLSFVPLAFATEPVVPSWLQGRAVILHPNHVLTNADRTELAKEGIFVRHALAGGRYLARVSDRATTIVARIGWIEPLTAKMKISRSALREVTRGKPWGEFNVIFHRDVSFDDARMALLASGAALIDPFATRLAPPHRLEVKIAPASLDALAADERVLMVTGPRRLRVKMDNALSAQVSHVTELYSAPYGLSGEGVAVSLFERAEAQASHPEFEGRLTTHATGGSSSEKSHATHVSGTIGAAGIRADAKGIAPKARIHQYCVACGQTSLKWMEIKRDDLALLGIVADNNSWGYVLGWSFDSLPVWTDAEEYYGAYDLIVVAPLDEISNDKNILFVHSAGNDASAPSFGPWSEHRHVDGNGSTIADRTFCYSANGSGSDCPAAVCNGGCETMKHHDTLPFDTIGVTAAAKNVVTVGAVRDNLEILEYSSRGPAKDGRVKPDVVARGFNVFSSVPTNSYGRTSGTSNASPVVTGIVAILTEQWRRTFRGANPTPAQLKALLIAGADDLGNPGPDYTYGFGLVNAKSSVDMIIADAGKGKRIRNLTLRQMQPEPQTVEMPVVVTQQEKLRVVLQWSDPTITYDINGPDIAPKALVNDLDLHVVDPSGNTIRPYILDKNNPTANATTGRNTVDNTEIVEIANAAAGTYRVVVTATSVLEEPQQAVLVTSADMRRVKRRSVP